ncbi:Glycosyl hydrolase, family 43 (fragment) [uncultured Paludibacter sp.]
MIFFKKLCNNKLLVILISILTALNVQGQTPVVKYAFNEKNDTDSIVDETGNGYSAKLIGSAKIKKIGKFGLLSIGSTTGYVDLTSKVGSLIGNLSNFTVSTYLYVDPSLNLSANGNFVWTFSKSADINSSATGCLFYTAKNSRYAICTTNYTTEKTLNINKAADKGIWRHITYVQSGTSGAIYIDGVLKKTGTINLVPSALGATNYNYLCKSSYASDQILLNSMLCDFRIYDTNLTASQISTLTVDRAALDTVTYTDIVDTALVRLDLDDVSAVVSDINLPATGFGNTDIQWSSSNSAVISSSGVVMRPEYGSENNVVTLTATVSLNFISKTKTFDVTVLPSLSDAQSVSIDSLNLALQGNLTNLRSDLILPSSGIEGSTITWNSSNSDVLSNSGRIINRPPKGSGKTKIILTATVTKGTTAVQKTFEVYVAEDEGFVGYLFAYFTGNYITQEAIRFAISDDGYTYSALNNNEPILNSADISSTGGVRDPHILRGENNDYYMVVTDMVSANGWNSNRAMVLLKSTDLINWQSSVINIPNLYPQYANADRVWAPQTIYDPSVGKYMVYFAMRLGSSDSDKIYYAYANDRFLGLESAPKLLFDNNGLSTIDADIVYKDGKYHLFFKTEGNGNGIKKAVSDKLTSDYVLYDKYLQCTTNAVEGGCVFRMYNTDNWMLIYDMYTSGAYQFTTSTDLENFSIVQNPVNFDFTPRHGTIIPITETEKQSLIAKWSSSGVNEKQKLSFNIYPNPAKDYFNITMRDNELYNIKIQIIDILGNKIWEKEITTNNERINVSQLNPGAYIINIRKNNATLGTKKIFIN